MLFVKCGTFMTFVTVAIVSPFCEAKVIVEHKEMPLYGGKPVTQVNRKPVVIIPGLMGSQLKARLKKSHGFKNCPTNKDWFTLWLDPVQLIPWDLDCWVDNTRLVYDNTTGNLRNSPGVEIQVPKFGSTVPFEYLDSSELHLGAYFAPLVEFLVESLGYKRGKELFGAPYDWRLSPRQHEKFFQKLTVLVEKVSRLNNEKVVILAHSMGGPFASYFLNSQSLEWRKQFVDSFVSIGGSLHGSVKSLKSVISGDAEGFEWIIDERKIQKLVKTLPSFFYMIPSTNLWPKEKEIVVVSPKRNYTVHDYKALFEDVDCKECWKLYQDAVVNLNKIEAPRVPVHCIFSSGIPTVKTMVYDKNFPFSSPKLIYGDGDGTINLWSAAACAGWQKKQSEPIYKLNLPRLTHIRLLSDSALHKYLVNVLT